MNTMTIMGWNYTGLGVPAPDTAGNARANTIQGKAKAGDTQTPKPQGTQTPTPQDTKKSDQPPPQATQEQAALVKLAADALTFASMFVPEGEEAAAGLEAKAAEEGAEAGAATTESAGTPASSGDVDISFGHGARHLEGTNLSQNAVEGAIRGQVQSAASESTATGSFWGRVNVGGTTIEYRAYTQSNGAINVGTYYPIP